MEWYTLPGLGRAMDTDVLVIGGGLGGALAAIRAKEEGAKDILLVEKGYFSKTGASGFAAGVITVFLPEEDDYDAWFQTLVEADDYLIDQNMNRLYLEEAHQSVKAMDRWGVQFVKKEGRYERVLARGGDPNRPVIKTMMFRGGLQMMEALRRQARRLGVRVVNRTMVTDLLTRDGRVVGAVGFETRTGEFRIFRAKATILASGGVAFKGGYYGQKNLTGDGHAMAYRAGAELMNYEFMGQHVMLPHMAICGYMMFVGMGGKFVNARNEPFLADYDPVLKDRTGLGTLAGAMALEARGGRGPLHLDMTHFTPQQVERLKEVLPLPTKALARAGILEGDRIARRMEMYPCLSGNLAGGGGLRVDETYAASLPGLFAAGPGASAPTAGRALSHCLASGPRAGRFAALYAAEADEPRVDHEQIARLKEEALAPLRAKEGMEPEVAQAALAEAIMPSRVFLLPTQESLTRALREVERLRDNYLPYLKAYDPHYLVQANEAKNMVLCAELWLRCALERKESRPGSWGFWREDYPETDNVNWLKWLMVKNEKGRPRTWTTPLPVDRYSYKPPLGQRRKVRLFEVAERRS